MLLILLLVFYLFYPTDESACYIKDNDYNGVDKIDCLAGVVG